MKRVTINAYQAGLLFRKGTYQKMLTEGSYWIWPSETVILCEKTRPLQAPVELNILLQDAQLKEALHVVEVKDTEMVILYENGLLTQVLAPGRYAYWKGVIDYGFVRADISKIEITAAIEKSTIHHRLLSPYVRTYTVENHEKALLFVDGKYERALLSGVYAWWKNPIAIQVAKVDSRQQHVEINGQEILTKDKAALRLNAWAQYRVTDVEKALTGNKDYEKQLYVAFQLALREYVGGLGFDELLEKKDAMSSAILASVSGPASGLGVTVLSFGVRDIVLPGDVKEIMNQVLVAEKKAQASMIMRREETAATRSLLNTARLLEDSPMLFKLKEMEYVEKIAEKVSSISVNGNGILVDQLRQIFVPGK